MEKENCAKNRNNNEKLTGGERTKVIEEGVENVERCTEFSLMECTYEMYSTRVSNQCCVRWREEKTNNASGQRQAWVGRGPCSLLLRVRE